VLPLSSRPTLLITAKLMRAFGGKPVRGADWGSVC